MHKNFKLYILIIASSMQLTQIIYASGLRAARAAKTEALTQSVHDEREAKTKRYYEARNRKAQQKNTYNPDRMMTLSEFLTATQEDEAAPLLNRNNQSNAMLKIHRTLPPVKRSSRGIIRVICESPTVNFIAGALTANVITPANFYNNTRSQELWDRIEELNNTQQQKPVHQRGINIKFDKTPGDNDGTVKRSPA